MPTPEEKAAFDQAGSIIPMIDLDRIEKAKLKTGPYRVVRGDVLEFTMPALLQAATAAEVQATQTRNLPVNPYLTRVRDNGAITLPAVGSMMVAGLSLAQIEEQVVKAYQHVVLQPSVFVRVAQYKTSKVYIAGAVRTPGVYALQADQMTLSSLLTQAGGISEVGAAVVRLVRSNPPKEAASDANDLSGASPRQAPLAKTGIEAGAPTRDGAPGASESKPILLPVVNTNIPYRDIALDEGDTVVVEPVRMPLFSVLGLVARPGNFPYPPNAQYNLTQAIAFAGGLDPVAQPRYVTIYRLTEDGSVVRAPFRLIAKDKFTDALGTPIRPGDVVAVENTPRTRMNSTIRELVRIDAGVYITGRDLWSNNN
jgi:protein involved in polysaccharide export with SLBB domain